jgi:hypothetical protein
LKALIAFRLTFLISLLSTVGRSQPTRQSLRSIEHVEDLLVEIMKTGHVIPDQILRQTATAQPLSSRFILCSIMWMRSKPRTWNFSPDRP